MDLFESTTVETSDSILQLSREPFRLACNTVRKAVAYLIVFFFKRTLQSKNTLIKQGSNVIDFGTKNPRNGPLTNGSGLYLGPFRFRLDGTVVTPWIEWFSRNLTNSDKSPSIENGFPVESAIR